MASRGMEKRDAVLARTGPAARALLAAIGRLPPGERASELARVLAMFERTLPGRVRKVASHLAAQGVAADVALERALALTLADASIEKVKRMGVAYQRGEVASMLSGCSGLAGCGGLGEITGSTPEAVVGGMFQGLLCSEGVRTSVTDMVGRGEGRDAADATTMGFAVAGGLAQCGAQSTTAPPSEVVTAEIGEESSSLAVPIALGVGAVVVIGGIVWWVSRKK